MSGIVWQSTRAQVAVILVNEEGAALVASWRQGVSESLDIALEHYQLTALSHKPLPGVQQVSNSFGALVAEAWQAYDHLVFVGATGIAVRAIAPLLANKFSDPSVVVVDIAGHHAISLLSGHAGGGNALADALERAFGPKAVITTGTEVMGIAALEPVLAQFGLSPRFYREAILAVNGALLRGERIALYGANASGFLEAARSVGCGEQFFIVAGAPVTQAPACIGLWIDVMAPETGWFEQLEGAGAKGFWLEVPTLVCGLGFRRGKHGQAIVSAISEALAAAGLRERQLAAFATIEIKAREAGFRAVLRHYRLPAAVVALEAIQAVAERYQASSFVQSTLGVPAVAEPCAEIAASAMSMGKEAQSLGRRFALDGVTVAFAALQKKVEDEDL